MTRCSSCDGILAKTDTACYTCGVQIARAKAKAPSSSLMILVVLVLCAGAYFFWSGSMS